MRSTGEAPFPTPTADDPVIEEIVRRLREVYQPLKIYLFGSVARGDAGPDSDYDFCVVVPDGERRDPRPGLRALWGLGVAKDLVIWPLSEFESRLHLRASLPATVVDEGKLIYAG
jgi:predicted nucleotidyltransferase